MRTIDGSHGLPAPRRLLTVRDLPRSATTAWDVAGAESAGSPQTQRSRPIMHRCPTGACHGPAARHNRRKRPGPLLVLGWDWP
ncbi:hypothetical protein ACI6Q5_16335 [Xanthomonas codiaei]|uniref:Uncharacterized protein n=1 Tax=Xanthomonas codiaei TaxID=56463 RepID=A0A2S7CS31_9XANT|nr:hypothetical protein [Xanthomonas codiaei]PPU64373.1 hypothetical protein XcodCFBP4690_09430 [Xanthomonas codiaei]